MIVVISFLCIIIIFFAIERIYRKFWDYQLEVDVRLPEKNVHEGEMADIKEVIINNKLLPIPILEVFYQLDRGLQYTDLSNAAVSDKMYRRDMFAVGIKRKISRTFEVKCKKRGYYSLDKLEMMSSDLFMRWKFLGEHKIDTSFYVYPRKVRSDKINLPYRQLMGELLIRKKLYEDPFSFGGIRDYVISDPMSTINWKATAKSQGLVVNMYDSSINQQVYILLDTYENKSASSEDLNEESIRIAAALSEKLLVQGVDLTMYGNGRDVLTKEILHLDGLKGLGIDVMKQQLARLERGEELPITSLFSAMQKDTYVVLISKNQDLHQEIKAFFDEFLWIIPYQYEEPDITNMNHRYIKWEMESANI